jgi:prevent-host-death family protein
VPARAESRSHQFADGYWALQDAKARFSELVRRVHSEGPQHVTVHGKNEVVVVAAEEFRRLKGARTGEAIVKAMQAVPYDDFEFELDSVRSPVRDVNL